jgi:hypothetical protein
MWPLLFAWVSMNAEKMSGGLILCINRHCIYLIANIESKGQTIDEERTTDEETVFSKRPKLYGTLIVIIQTKILNSAKTQYLGGKNAAFGRKL